MRTRKKTAIKHCVSTVSISAITQYLNQLIVKHIFFDDLNIRSMIVYEALN
ncbi:hypothetical protein MAH4_20460 [Sessilibacter sp. MAH4]